MADAGRGASYHIETPEQAPGIFEEELQGLMALAAQNLSVTVRPDDAMKLVAVPHDYPHHVKEGVLRMELGDLYASEPRQVLLEFLLEEAEPGAVIPVGELRAASLDDDEVAAEAHDLERPTGTFEQGLAQSADIKHMKQMVRDGLQSRFSARNRYRRNE